MVLERIITTRLFIVGLFLGCSLCASAQVTGGGSGSAPQAPARPAAVVQPSGAQTPQVVTVVHRLSGMKVLSLLRRGGQSPTVVDDEFVTTRDMLTSVTAGFALGDGKSVVARLPQAEAEIEADFNWTAMPASPSSFPQPAMPAMPAPAAVNAYGFQSPPELQVIQRNGRARAARYIGLDVGTGLSLIQVEGLDVAPLRDAREEQLVAGQRVRLLAPQRINAASSVAQAAAPGKLYLAVGAIEGEIAVLKRPSNGKLALLIVRAPKLNSAFAGGVVLDETGATIGIVETSDAGEARVLPMARVRSAAERVLARRGNVPHVWLGVRGQALTATTQAQLLARGWTQEEAALLQAKQYGILLTAIAPNTPAAQSNLRSGDVIVKLNEDVVKNVEDFSFMLNEAGSGATVNFTVLRRFELAQPPVAVTPTPAPLPAMQLKTLKPVVVQVKLSESLNPARWTWRETEIRARSSATDPLAAAGIEGIPLSPRAATRLGARSGLLVVFVGPGSAASRAGLRVFDIIESVDGQLISPSRAAAVFNSDTTQPKTFIIIRDHQKFSFSFSTEDKKKQ